MSDRARVLDRLRRGSVHSIELRREGYTGNPSQRINELIEEGHTIRRDPEPWKDAEGKQRGGVRYTLIGDAESSTPTDEPGGAPAPLPDHAAGFVGEAHDDSGLTADSPLPHPAPERTIPGEGQDAGQPSEPSLFSLAEIDLVPGRPSYMDADLEDAA